MLFRSLPSVLVLFLFTTILKAQLPNGTTAPDFTTTDIYGVTHNLYDYLDDGYTVILKFTATWCGPCWNYHNTGALETVWDNYGPDGTDEAIVLFLESDPSTGLNCLYGESSCPSSQGNWVDGTNFPIINDHIPSNDYAINFYPTIYGICPDKKVTLIGQAPASGIYNFIQNCKIVNYQPVVDNVNCKGGSDGAISLNILGGMEPISFEWSTGSTSTEINNLSAGSYTVTMTDGLGNITISNPIIVSEPEMELSAVASNVTPDNCFGNNGVINLNTIGGTTPYEYTWSHGSTDQNPEGLTPGQYSVSIEDANGCQTNVESIEVGSIPPPEAFVTGETVLDCINITTTLDGSSSSLGPQYSYEWSTDFGNIVSGQNTTNIVVNASGTYTLFVTDNDWNCTTSASISTIEINDPPAVNTSDIDYIPCGETSITLSGNGDSGTGYNIEWTSDNGQIIEGQNTFSPLIEGAGNYTLNILNEFTGCEASSSVLVELAEPAELTSALDHIACFGESTGNINLTIDGDHGPFDIEWSNGENQESLSNIPAGSYDVTVTDSKNCVSNGSFTITEPDQIEVTLNIIHASGDGQNDGAVTVNTSGGVEPYEIEWSNGATSFALDNLTPGSYNYTITDANECTFESTAIVQASGCSIALEVDIQQHVTCPEGQDGVVVISSPNAEGSIVVEWNDGFIGAIRDDLSAGTYQVFVIDEDGCPGQSTLEITEPPALEINISSITPFDCAVNQYGELTIEISGGTGDAYDVNWSNGASGSTIDNLIFGNITATITDEANCQTEFAANIPVENYQPPTAIAVDTLEIFLDEEGQISIDPLDIDAGSFSVCDSQQDILAYEVSQSEFDCNDLGFQEVVFIISDPTGQTDTAFTTVHVLDITPPQITCPESFSVISCNQAIIYDEIIATDNCNVSITQITGPESGDDFDFGMNELVYQASDESGNTSSCSFSIELERDQVSVEEEVIHCTCYGFSDGQIALDINPGASDTYNITWNNNQENEVVNDLNAGTYIYTILTGNDCYYSDTIEVNQPDSLFFNLTRVNQDDGSASGEIELSISGGVPPYTIIASGENHETQIEGSVLTNLNADVYDIMVIDANSCESQSAQVEIQLQVSTEEFNNDVRFTVAPNPASSIVNLIIDGSLEKDVEVNLFDSYGKKVLYKRLGSNIGSNRYLLDVNHLPSGFYQIMVTSGQELFNKGLLIHH